MHFSAEMISSNSHFVKFFCLGLPTRGALNKDPTVWLDGARPANTCAPSSFLGECTCATVWLTHLKNMFASIEISAKFGKNNFILFLKIRERVS